MQGELGMGEGWLTGYALVLCHPSGQQMSCQEQVSAKWISSCDDYNKTVQ